MMRVLAVAVVMLSPSLSFAWGFGCDSKNDTTLAPDRTVVRQTIEVKKISQNVIHHDCAGKVTKQAVEVVQAPEADIAVQSVGVFHANEISKVTVYNRTTCQDQGFANSLSDGLTNTMMASLIAVDQAAGLAPTEKMKDQFRVNVDTDIWMHVLPNHDNYIDYAFEKCANLKTYADGSTKCLQSVDAEKGTLVLTVKYQDVHLDGSKDVRPTDAECDTNN